jgi:predicted ATPase
VRSDLPIGTVTFLFTDVEGSTKLLHELGARAYAVELARHRRVVRETCSTHGGVEVDTQGDAFFFAFSSASGAVVAARAITEALIDGLIHLRIGLHTGAPLVTEEGYVGDDVHLAARVAASGHGGQVLLSKSTSELADGLSLIDLGEHRLKDIDGAVSIYQLGNKSFPPLKTISNTNLPRPASSFVGRERELSEVLAILQSGSRLLTLTGSGGSGKTRLALEAAAALVPSYKAGVFWVGLASLRESSLVMETIAQTLGAKDGLAEYIGGRRMLLLLDNLEQVIEAAGELSSLLGACPDLTLLCTSRELLRIQGEVRYAVPPLASAEAVALFCERSAYAPSGEIAELCDRLDDLPLAVELAAARTSVLSPAQILERVSERLDLFRGGRDAEARQQTLRTTIAWSHDLLSDEEQRVFRALSVFAGGCTFAAAEKVGGAGLDTLQSLLEKSLLRFTDERYWMLETVREYALEELEVSSGAEVLRDRHAWHFLDQLEKGRLHVRGPRRAELLAWFDAEEANLRATLDRLEHIAAPDAARAADHLVQFWSARGQMREGRKRLEKLLARDDLFAGDRAMLLAGLSDYESRMGETSAAESHAHEALGLAEESSKSRVSAVRALDTLAYIALFRGDYVEARHWADRMLAEAGDDEGLRALALSSLANVEKETGGRLEARTKLLDAIQAARAAGDVVREIVNTLNLGWLELYAHEFDAARMLALSVFDKLTGDHYEATAALQTLGHALVGLGRRGEARDALAKSLDLAVTSGMTGEGLVTDTLAGIAYASEQDGLDSAAQLLGVAHRFNDETGRLERGPQLELKQFFAQPLIDALGAETYASEHARGATMTLDEAIELAQSLVERSAPAPPAEQAPRA